MVYYYFYFLQYAQGGFNYTYGGDIIMMGASGNDLIYIPTTAEISTMIFSSAGQGAAFDKFISQDDYMSGRRGQYVERYGALAPWKENGMLKLYKIITLKFQEIRRIQFNLVLMY
jgi:hypothetical protein